jgi:creatinine amidohydrolase
MSWTAVQDAVSKDPRLKAILPVGSVEQHGPHLPLGTDSVIAEHIASKVSGQFPSILFPTLSIGYSLEHAGFPGTISFTMQTYSSMITEIAKNLFDSGFRTLIAINGHGGNRAILDSSLTAIKHTHPDLSIFSFTVLDIARVKFSEVRKSPRKMIGHADELETSMMLAIRPDMVQMSKAVAEEPKFPLTVSLESEDLAKVTYAWMTKDVTKSGIIGNPNFATPEIGRLLLDYVVEFISSTIRG